MDNNDKTDIWVLAQQAAADAQSTASTQRTLLFVGNKCGGKTSIISRFIDKNETPKPTLALEYSFARKPRSDGVKDLCNIWELGGGTLFTNLLEFAVTQENVHELAIVLVVDLSLPEQMIVTIDTLMENLRERMNSLLSKPNNYILKETLRQSMLKRVGESHEDISELNLFQIPLVILGSKYDVFQKKKTIGRLLRLSAHINGASLFFVTTMSETLMNKVKLVLGGLAFGGSTLTSLTPLFDHNKPLVVPFGADNFQLIGYNSLESMRRTFVQNFPQVATKVVIPDNPAKDPNFAERDIDLVRAHKDKELDEYRRQLELRQNIIM